MEKALWVASVWFTLGLWGGYLRVAAHLQADVAKLPDPWSEQARLVQQFPTHSLRASLWQHGILGPYALYKGVRFWLAMRPYFRRAAR